MRIFLRMFAVLVILCAIAIGAYTVWQAAFYNPDSEITPSGAVVISATSTQPVRLQIPSLNIDANVQHVGVGKSGSMAVPTNYTDVGWYRYGPAPGHLGSAVIDGHVDNGFGLPAVFKRLSEIQVGDDVYTIDSSGSKLHFVVTAIEGYPYDSAPAERIFAQADKARLNLITCQGTWIPSKKMYDRRLVVYTELSAT